MAHFLDYVTASGKYLQMPSGSADIAAGQNFELEFELKRVNATNTRFLGRASASGAVRFPTTTSLAVVNSANGSATYTAPANFTDFIHYRIWRSDGANVNVSINGDTPQTAAQSGAFIFNRFFADASGVSASAQVKFIKLSKDGVLTNHWVNTTGTGTQMPDVVGGQPFNQMGTWPANDSEWVFYDATTQLEGVSTFTVSANVTTELQGHKIGAASLAVSSNVSSASLGSKIGIVENSFFASGAATIYSNKVGNATIYMEAEAAISVYAGTLYVGEATFSVNAVAGATVQGSKEGSGQIQFQAAAAVYCQAVKVGVATTAIYASAAAETFASKIGQSEPHAAANAALSIDGYKVGFGSTAVLASVSATLSSSNPAAVPAPITIVFVRTSSRYKHQLQTLGRYSYLIKTQSGGARV